MADLGVFLEKEFDPKAYINAACTNKPADQALDRYLSELEMKLHLGSEDIGLYLQDQATRAAARIPVAARELARIREDAAGVRAAVATALAKLQDDSASRSATAAALTALSELDAVKGRMEAACSTLKEAAGLSTLFHLVEDLFTQGDLPRAADALAGIRRGLAVVADSVPEFRDGPQRLAKLEGRFAAAAAGPLAAALTAQRAEEAAALAGMLASAGREDQVREAYVSARSAPLAALWESYTPGTPFVPWLSTFYDQLLRSAVAECGWAAGALPDRFPALPLGLLASFFASIDKPHRARLAGALTGAQGSLLPLESLEQAAAAAADFVAGLRSELAAAGAWDPEEGLALLQATVGPVEGAILQYPDRELQYLTAEMPRLLAPGREAAAGAPLDLPDALGDSVDPAFAAAAAAVGRCTRLTGGTALPALGRVVDRVLQQYIAAVQATIASAHGPKSGAPGGSPAKPGAAVAVAASAVANAGAAPAPEAVLPLLLVVAKVQKRLEECAAAVAAAAAADVPAVLSAPAPGDVPADQPLSLVSLRLAAQPALRQQLSTFAATASAAAALPSAAAALRALQTAVDALAERALCGKVADLLAAVPSLTEWQAAPASSVPLPSFTPYPLQYVTAAGEYLMLLPQLLESALAPGEGETTSPLEATASPRGDTAPDDDDAATAQQLVAEWVDRAALAAAEVYLRQLRRLKGLSAQGAGQLGADLEYFGNVLSTLGLGVPPELAAWQAALVAPDAAALDGLRGLGGGVEAAAAVEAVARLRGIALPHAASSSAGASSS